MWGFCRIKARDSRSNNNDKLDKLLADKEHNI